MLIEELLEITSFQVKVSIFTKIFSFKFHQTLMTYSHLHANANLPCRNEH